MRHQDIVSRMTLDEKADYVSGDGFWRTKAIPRLGIPSIEMTDGPHGLRKLRDPGVQGDFSDLVRTTAFPTASLSACSFDPGLLREMGEAIAAECRAHGVSLILGPGANLKRSPLCGRNFEYFSEDPLLSSEMAAAWILGAESAGVGTSLKHFAANNQEKRRMFVDAVVDPRALHELYLSSFEGAVREGRPSTVMCSYNRLNGTCSSESRFLHTETLRDEWGFEGLVVTDWGATHDRVAGIQAGVDLEMPSTGRSSARAIVAAVREGRLDERDLDLAADRVLDFVMKATGERPAAPVFTPGGHHELSRRIARESMVLLKNDGGLLPLDPAARVTVIGELARSPRYQGAGSSFIAPTELVSFLDALPGAGVSFDFAPGYRIDTDAPDKALVEEAVTLARDTALRGGKLLLVAGLTDDYESEGFDREHMLLPPNQSALIPALAAECPDLAVLLVGGSPVETPWLDSAKALLAGYLGGQALGQAQCDLVFGAANPSGKLAESWPLSLEDNPSRGNFPGGRTVLYKEGIFVGYRWYASAGKPVRFPFGHGLSYTGFRYDALELSSDAISAGNPPGAQASALTARVSLTNTGTRTGKEAVQLYVSFEDSRVERPALALAGFLKVELEPGRSATVEIPVSPTALRHWNDAAGRFSLESCHAVLRAGGSSDGLPLSARFRIDGEPADGSAPRHDLSRPPAAMKDAQFERLLGRPIPPPAPRRPYGPDSILAELAEDSLFARIVRNAVVARLTKGFGADRDSPNRRMMVEMANEMPIAKFTLMSGGAFGTGLVHALAAFANKRPLRAIACLAGFSRGEKQ